MRTFIRWDQEFSTEDSNELLSKISLTLCNRIFAKKLRERLALCITSDDFHTLCNLDLDYSAISVADSIAARQILAFYSKREDLTLGVDRTAVALAKFKESESLCRETNTLFKLLARGRFQFRPRVDRILFDAQRKIAKVLGCVPDLESLKLRFGPGATANVKKSDACPRVKLSKRMQCSEDLLPLVSQLLEEMPSLVFPDKESPDTALVDVDVVPSRLCFVPKNSKTDRSIGTEPVLNTMIQAGIGDYMAGRLKRFGIDITDQTLNQRLAREGSITGALATLDLSSASDTISTELVAHLLPIDWFVLLDQARSSFIKTPDGIIHQEKFSSMGNGFTFPLETLIFWALARSVVDYFEGAYEEQRISVYGDDIIVPCYAVEYLTTVLTDLGFIINKSKSFAVGPFRESCGADYLSGIDIRPVYQKTRLSGADAFRLFNFFKRKYDDEICQIILQSIHPQLRIYGPDGYGDGHLLGDWSPKPHKRKLGWAGYTFETYSWKGRKKFRALPGDYVYPAYSIYVKGPDSVPPDSGGRTNLLALPEDSPGPLYDKAGRLGDILPGRKGYKRISIYTLTC